jgi:hypothetical protein
MIIGSGLLFVSWLLTFPRFMVRPSLNPANEVNQEEQSANRNREHREHPGHSKEQWWWPGD